MFTILLEMVVAAIMLVSLSRYALIGGADYGGGMWDLLASGLRAQRQRHAIVEAIAPMGGKSCLAGYGSCFVVFGVPSRVFDSLRL
jgi:hypothetical protein